MRPEIEEQLEDMYGFADVPQYIVGAGKTYITIRAAIYEGAMVEKVKVTIKDITEYYATQLQSMSGIRTLAGFSTDHRTVDVIAQECLDWFKRVNRPVLEREAHKWGMELRS